MLTSRISMLALSMAIVLPLAGVLAGTGEAQPSFHLVKTVPLGGADKWDYLVYDQDDHRLFVSHGSEVTVLDSHEGTILGRIGGLTGAHGIALVPELGRGYIANNDRATVFDLTSLAVVAEIPAGSGADAITYDPASHRVFVMNGKAGSVSVIDPAANKVVATIPLAGQPEFSAADGRGSLYINIESNREIVRLDTKTLTIAARWPISDCEAPHGLAVDGEGRKLFSSCVNAKLMTVDADSGKIIAALPIGKGSDAVVYDPPRKRAYSSNGDGSLSMIAETEDGISALPPATTAPGARTMAQDPANGRIFLVTNDRDQGRIVPGSVKALFFDPSDR
jgi:YVTN family beta-propeller protein